MSDILLMSGPAAFLVAAIVFLGLYSRLPWAVTAWGRSMMLGGTALALVAATTILSRLDDMTADIDLSWAHTWPRTIAWWVAAAVYLWKARQTTTGGKWSNKTDARERSL